MPRVVKAGEFQAISVMFCIAGMLGVCRGVQSDLPRIHSLDSRTQISQQVVPPGAFWLNFRSVHLTKALIVHSWSLNNCLLPSLTCPRYRCLQSSLCSLLKSPPAVTLIQSSGHSAIVTMTNACWVQPRLSTVAASIYVHVLKATMRWILTLQVPPAGVAIICCQSSAHQIRPRFGDIRLTVFPSVAPSTAPTSPPLADPHPPSPPPPP